MGDLVFGFDGYLRRPILMEISGMAHLVLRDWNAHYDAF